MAFDEQGMGEQGLHRQHRRVEPFQMAHLENALVSLASMIRSSASPRVVVIGFSTITSTPADRQALPTSWW